MSIKKNFVVIGLGAFGNKICEILTEGGGNVIAIDKNADTLDKVKNFVSAAILIDTTNEGDLLKAPLDDIDIAIVAIGDNIEASILTTTLLKQRGIPYIVARTISPLHATVLRRVGANEVLNIEVSSATSLARRLVAPDRTNSIAITEDVTIREIIAPKFFDDKTIDDLALRDKFNLKIIAAVRTEIDIDSAGNSIPKKKLYYPDNIFTFKSADRIFVLGKNHDIKELIFTSENLK
ncbi:TrkA family potassium uptake protein [Treponema phagedenis]|uniref:TrkA N-terminal domain protein n=1 Tax=Treponema phagedenis TaxID=162 RepID=A0A0B7GW98_TREPH|nr:TrkA family potassium uptake protein [Treponema phagedenis]NVP23401.1 TrkA family potassium uptake protein [Treponema phagedenis]QEJ96499.1 TrkA family potassium uptake protein [Treponema phagedenis]QEJ99648.1 TrkA family potassium uptake protein [Treponema phagedenis]QEK02282.1 TrkA family potassium uptake protein [Treponema phagedenis]QEK05201.1 TrkA family potassium uptake protein [Treponema phagedenis]